MTLNRNAEGFLSSKIEIVKKGSKEKKYCHMTLLTFICLPQHYDFVKTDLEYGQGLTAFQLLNMRIDDTLVLVVV